MKKESMLFSPIKIQTLTLANRITMTPLYLGYANKDGTVSELILKHYRKMAQSGASLIVVENAAIHESGLGSPFTLRVDNDSCIAGLSKVAETIHNEGTLAFLQINHAGRYAFTPHRLAPSPIKIGEIIPKEMTLQEIRETINAFADAARRVKESGFDGVELHGGTGYLLSQFVSPRINKRNDIYGGSMENRFRFPIETIKAVQNKVGTDYPVGYRFLADELLPQAFHIDEAEILAKEIEKLNIAYLSVMVGTHESLHIPPYVEMEKNECYMAEYAFRIKKAVSKTPIITAGRIQTPEGAESILREGRADLIGLARILFADPLWPKKAQGLIKEPIILCNPMCSHCLKSTMKETLPYCTQWPKEERDSILTYKRD